MIDQRHLFSLPNNVHYINCAYMSPILKSSEEAGIIGISRKRNPGELKAVHFFDQATETRQSFGALINAPHQQIAIIPSASYGLKSAISNVIPKLGQHAITISEEFPSGYFTLVEWAKKHQSDIKVIEEPRSKNSRAKLWNEMIIDAIDEKTAMVMLSSVQWTDGTIFDLKEIGLKCKEYGVAFIVDGTQSVGIAPLDVVDFNISALICACYKWLLGPYSTAMAYFSSDFDNGIPIEDSWMNRSNAQDFANLTDYDELFTSGAGRYNVGEFSNFIALPMLLNGFNQISDWGVENLKEYCAKLTLPLIEFLTTNSFWIEDEEYRSSHLFGFKVPEKLDKIHLLEKLMQNKVYLSLRKDSIRVSPHVFNTEEDIQILINILKEEL